MESIIAEGLSAALPIRTKRLLIRPFRPGDANALYMLHKSSKVTRYAGGTKTKSESELALQRLVSKVQTTGFGALAVEELTSGEVIGWCGIQRMREFDEFEIVYALQPRWWGQGIAHEASMAVIATAFATEELGIKRVFGLVFPQNSRSIRVLEKLGMNFVRTVYDDASGKYACLYSVKRSQFPINQSSSK